jgi:ubiquinone/menaquinone biosynthesis C-methylase UbiE
MCMSRVEKWMVNSERRQRSRQEQARRLFAHIPMLEARAAYLEVGCGAGAVAACVASELGLSATGIDIDTGQIASARDAFGAGSARFVAADAARLPFADESFDIVLSFMATHHIEELDRALGEIRRVLKPGGHFVYADVFLPRVIAVIAGVLGHAYHLPRPDVMRGVLERDGFTEVHASRDAKQFFGPYEAVYARAG